MVSNNSNANPLIKQFINFANSYSKIDKIDENVLKIVNKAFKKYNEFDLGDPNQSALHIRKKGGEFNMTDFCKANANKETSMIPITLNDEKLSSYIKVYTNMKLLYIKECENLFNILENDILMTSVIKDKEEPHFTIKNIGYEDLVVIETKVRNQIVYMYSQCHEQYQKGIVELFNALKQSSYKNNNNK